MTRSPTLDASATSTLAIPSLEAPVGLPLTQVEGEDQAPFKLGDRVRHEDRPGRVGTVTHIDWEGNEQIAVSFDWDDGGWGFFGRTWWHELQLVNP